MELKIAGLWLVADGIPVEIGKRLTQTGGVWKSSLQGCVRLLEILVESPPRVIAAWLPLMAPCASLQPLLLQTNNCRKGPWSDQRHVEIVEIYFHLHICMFTA